MCYCVCAKGGKKNEQNKKEANVRLYLILIYQGFAQAWINQLNSILQNEILQTAYLN
jgi:hypothetical protein